MLYSLFFVSLHDTRFLVSVPHPGVKAQSKRKREKRERERRERERWQMAVGKRFELRVRVMHNERPSQN